MGFQHLFTDKPLEFKLPEHCTLISIVPSHGNKAEYIVTYWRDNNAPVSSADEVANTE